MHTEQAERLGALLAQLRAAHATLSERQRELLEAVASDRPRQDLCREVRVLSERVLALVARVGDEV